MKRLVPRPSYANVVATVALFIALGGASYAATQLPKNSVGTKQIKASAITTAKIKNGAVTGAKVNVSTLGTVPSATKAEEAATAEKAAIAGQASSLNAPEAVHFVGAPGEPQFGSFITVGASPLGFYKDHDCRVHLLGEMGGQAGLVFTLPAGFRPAQPASAALFVEPQKNAQVKIGVDGKVEAEWAGAGEGTYLGLDSVSFRAAEC